MGLAANFQLLPDNRLLVRDIWHNEAAMTQEEFLLHLHAELNRLISREQSRAALPDLPSLSITGFSL